MLSRIYLLFNAVGIGAIGLLYLYDPNLLLARYSLETGSAGMDNMVRSAYGGVYLACAFVFLLGALQIKRRRDAVGFSALFMTGAAIGRVASIGAAGAPPATIMPLLYFEIGAALIGIILFLISRPAD